VAQKDRDELLRRQQEQELAFQAQISKLTRQLSEAKSDADREALRQQIEQANSRRATAAAATRTRSPKEAASRPSVPQDLIKAKKQVSNDPLDGL
jgi:predicted  nucleic acid-binding Zn-ribbon protein